jgi:hypothetical protein
MRGRLASLIAGVLVVSGAWGCDSTAGPDEATIHRRPVESALLDPAAPRPATAGEQAMLATPVEVDMPPEVAGLAASQSSFASAASCNIGFADYIGLLILPDKAGHTFASSPYYIQGCGSGWVHVKENDVARYGSSWGSSYNHYHLMYEKGGYCVPAGGSWGYQLNGNCVLVPDPATEARYLAAHYGNQWIRVYVYKSGVSEMTFDFKSIRVKGTQSIKLWFRKADGSWWHWNSLGVGTWNVAPYAAGIREILFSASGSSTSSYSVDDIVVGVT